MQHRSEDGSLFSNTMTLKDTQNPGDVSELIAENFGANATYVEGLLARWRSDPALVDESWRAYFEELAGPNGDRAAGATVPVTATTGTTVESDGPTATAPAKTKQTAAPVLTTSPDVQVEVLPIRGPALKIVENMEASLAVPTATSLRRIPVRLLDENRRIINRHLETGNQGKASYTHLIAFALLRALEEFPQMNDGFAVIE